MTREIDMQAIQAPIRPDQAGPEVANLQDALLVFLEQSQHKIIEALTDPNRPTRDELRRLTEGLREERVRSHFHASTHQLLIYFQLQQNLGDQLRDVGVDTTTACKLNEWLGILQLIDVVESDGFVVRGTVRTTQGQPVAGVIVRVFDRDLRKLQPLSEAETDVVGAYRSHFESEKFASGDLRSASAPTLVVRAFVSDKQIGEDVIRKRPSRDEVVDIAVPAPEVSEWEKLSASIVPLLQGQGEGEKALPPWEIDDRDLNFIAEETGLERESIRLWALAFAVGRSAGVDLLASEVINPDGLPHVALRVPVTAGEHSTFAIFYGWFRLGMPTDWQALQVCPISMLRRALLDAVDQNIIPATIREAIETILESSTQSTRCGIGRCTRQRGPLAGEEARRNDTRRHCRGRI